MYDTLALLIDCEFVIKGVIIEQKQLICLFPGVYMLPRDEKSQINRPWGTLCWFRNCPFNPYKYRIRCIC